MRVELEEILKVDLVELQTITVPDHLIVAQIAQSGESPQCK